VSEISFDEVVRLIEGEGFAAFVQQTGGGVATVYASRKDATGTLRTHEVGPYHDEHYEVAVGPGWFDGAGWTNGRGDTSDLYVGIDGDESPSESPWSATVPASATEQEVAARAVALLRRYDEWPGAGVDDQTLHEIAQDLRREEEAVVAEIEHTFARCGHHEPTPACGNCKDLLARLNAITPRGVAVRWEGPTSTTIAIEGEGATTEPLP
jgi:hypothetical protein